MTVDIRLNQMIAHLDTQLKNISLDDVELSVRTLKALKLCGATTLGDAHMVVWDGSLRKQYGIGPRAVREVEEIITNISETYPMIPTNPYKDEEIAAVTDEIERKWLDEAARLAGWEDWVQAYNRGTVDLRDIVRAHACTLRDFDAFRREVSEAVTDYCGVYSARTGALSRFVLPAPDPLAEQLGPELAAQVREKVPGAVKVEVGDA